MASMKDAQQLTEELRTRADELHGELTDGEIDFEKITRLADQLGAAADRVATTFQRINDAFDESEEGGESGNGQSLTDALSPGAKGQESSEGGEGPSREELYELAKKADIPGRSEMSKNQLERALKRAGEKVA
jgi:predicted nuclease with TOPRIM domain